MRILHLNAGNETGGGMYHILSLLKELNRDEFILGVLEKGELWRKANEAGIRTVYFSNRTRWSVPVLQKIVHYIKREKVNIVHTHGPRANVYANMVKKLVSFQWIVTVHSNPLFDFMGKGMYGNFLCKLNIRAVKHADKIITVSEPFGQNLQEIGIEAGKIITAWNGIDFRTKVVGGLCKSDFGISDKEIVFLKVARLEPVKGHRVAFEAFSEILKVRGNCHLLIVGDGAMAQELKQLASTLQISNHIHFLGHRDDVELLYEMADITMLTSYSEGFPLVLLESARAKTPIIATDVGGVSKLIKDQSLGWKIQPQNVAELTRAMEQAIFFHKKGMLKPMGEKLHQYASTEFSVEIFANNIYNIYLGMEHNKIM